MTELSHMNFTNLFFLLAALLGIALASAPVEVKPADNKPAVDKKTDDKKAEEKNVEVVLRMTSVACDTIKVPVTEFVTALVKEKVNLMDYTKCTKDQVAELEKALTSAKFTVAKTDTSVTSVAEELTKLKLTHETAKALVKNDKIENVAVGKEKVAVHVVTATVPQAEGCPMWYWVVGGIAVIILIGGIAFFVLRK